MQGASAHLAVALRGLPRVGDQVVEMAGRGGSFIVMRPSTPDECLSTRADAGIFLLRFV